MTPATESLPLIFSAGTHTDMCTHIAHVHTYIQMLAKTEEERDTGEESADQSIASIYCLF